MAESQFVQAVSHASAVSKPKLPKFRWLKVAEPSHATQFPVPRWVAAYACTPRGKNEEPAMDHKSARAELVKRMMLFLVLMLPEVEAVVKDGGGDPTIYS